MGKKKFGAAGYFRAVYPSRWRPCPQPGIYMSYFVAVLLAPEESQRTVL